MEGRWDLLHTCKDGQDSSPHRNDRLQEVRGKLVERRKDTGLHTSIPCSECPGLSHMTNVPEKHWQCQVQPSILQECTTAGEHTGNKAKLVWF